MAQRNPARQSQEKEGGEVVRIDGNVVTKGLGFDIRKLQTIKSLLVAKKDVCFNQ